MKTCNWENEHYAHSDIELNIPRQSKLVSYCTAPWEPDAARPYAGLVLVLHGFGQLANDEYTKKLRSYLAEKYELLAVSPNFHASGLHILDLQKRCAVPEGIFSRTLYYLSDESKSDLLAHAYEKQDGVGWINFYENYLDVFLDCVSQIEELENKEVLPFFKVFSDNYDYQNFGVMQSLDVLTVLYDLSEWYAFDRNNVIAFGSSHGGYLAHLCSKIAPNSLRAVIDSSSYPYATYYLIADKPYAGVTPFFKYDLGDKENPLFFFSRPVYFDTRWELADSTSQNFYGLAPMQMRNLNHTPHWQEVIQKGGGRCQYRMVYSSQDQVFQPLDDKRNQVSRLVEAGFDVEYREMGESDVDGKLVKHLGHGMGTSLRGLFDIYYPSIKSTKGRLDNELGTVVDFVCGDKVYRFDHAAKPMLKII